MAAIGQPDETGKHTDQWQYHERLVAGVDRVVLEPQRNGVGADAEERRVPQRRIAGEAADQVPGAGHRREHQHEDQQVEHPVLPGRTTA